MAKPKNVAQIKVEMAVGRAHHGVAHMADGGILDGHPVFQTSQVPFAEYRHSIGMNHGGVSMAGGGRPPLRSLDEVPSDEYLKAEIARINAAPTVRANSADETANYARYVAERAGQPIEMPARPDYTPGFSVLEKPTYGSEVPSTTPTIDQQRYELTMRGQQDAANKQYRAQQGDALAGMDPTGTLAVTDAARTMGLGMLALPVHAGRSAFHYLQHGNMKDAPTGMDYEEFMSPRTPEGAELVEEIGTAGSRIMGAERGFGMNPNLWTYTPPTLAQMRAGLKLGAERAAPVLGKVDKFVRKGYDSGTIPQPGFSTKDVTPKALAPANEQGFYSPTEAAALNLQRKTGNGQAFMNDLLKQENVRPEEIKTIGLDTFLKDKKNVTAAEVQDYIAKNKLGLGESVYDNKPKPNFMEFLHQKGIPQEDVYRILEKAENGIFDKQVAPLRDEWVNSENKSTKFQEYQLPGGENYREVVLTLPLENTAALEAAQIKAGDARRQTADLSVQYRNQKEIDPQSPRVLEAWQKLEESRNLHDKAEAEADALRRVASQNTYHSSHFDEPNVLAHLRMSDRVTDGKKTLLVDEVQSDWHQAGREYGYANPEERQKIVDKLAREEPLTDEEEAARLMHLKGRTVPNAPYKEDWYQLALRRAVKEAIDGGYDRVALPTGQRVADRFDLSKQISEVHYSGTNLKAYDLDGNEVISQTGIKPEDLPSYIGKETANKLLEQPKQGTLRSLVGQDLKVGGEGMKKYYDEIYPTYLKKFGKKYGASVGTTYAKTDIQEWPFPIQIESDGKNFWLFGQDPRIDKKAKLSSNFSSYEDANKFRDSMYEGNTEPLHYMDITPAMRKEFSTGIHMAKGGKVSFVSNVDAMRYELTKAK